MYFDLKIDNSSESAQEQQESANESLNWLNKGKTSSIANETEVVLPPSLEDKIKNEIDNFVSSTFEISLEPISSIKQRRIQIEQSLKLILQILSGDGFRF